MAARDQRAVEARIRRLDDEGLAAFVADLWRERGYETTREGDVVVAARGESRVRVAALARSRLRPGRRSLPDRPVDVVVAPAGVGGADVPEDVRVLDATALREMLWYALGDRERTRLCLGHFGAAPSQLSLPWPDRVAARLRGLGTAVRDGVPVGSAGVPVGVAVALVVAAAAVLLWTGGFAVGPLGSGAAGPAGPSGQDGPVATPASLPTDTDSATAADLPPPGVTEAGVENLTALASAHDRALADLSYTVWMDVYRPRSHDGPRVQRDVDVAVVGNRYVVSQSLGDGRDRRRFGSVYFDGTDWYVERDGANGSTYARVAGTRAAPLAVPDPFVLRRSLVERYLSTPTTDAAGPLVRDGRRFYRVTGEGRPSAPALAGATNYTVTALVDGQGVVHDLTVEYSDTTVTGSPRVRFEATYGRFGSTSLSAPPWYDEQFGSEGSGTPTANGTVTTPGPPANATATTPGPPANATATPAE